MLKKKIYWLKLISRIKRNRLMMLGSFITLIFVLIALFAPVITSSNARRPYQMPRDWSNILVPPGTHGHLLGTTTTGGDIFYGLVWGARITIQYAFIIGIIQIVIGTLVGALAGYFGGWIDTTLMRITDLFLSIPMLILAMPIAMILGVSMNSIAIALIVVGWTRIARIVRSAVLETCATEYIQSAEAIGCNDRQIMIRHVLPNSISPLLVQGTLNLGNIILAIAGLSFIGLAPAGLTEWGRMVALGQERLIEGYWWPVVFPGLSIFLFVLGINLLGDGIRDLMDPSLKNLEQG